MSKSMLQEHDKITLQWHHFTYHILSIRSSSLQQIKYSILHYLCYTAHIRRLCFKRSYNVIVLTARRRKQFQIRMVSCKRVLADILTWLQCHMPLYVLNSYTGQPCWLDIPADWITTIDSLVIMASGGYLSRCKRQQSRVQSTSASPVLAVPIGSDVILIRLMKTWQTNGMKCQRLISS